MSAIIPEFKKRIIADFAEAVANELPALSIPKNESRKGIGRYRSTRPFFDGRIVLDLEFLEKNRFYLFFTYLPRADLENIVRIDTFDLLPPQSSLQQGCWCDVRNLPCMADVSDDYWIPQPPTAERYLQAMLATERGRRQLPYVVVEDDLVAAALETGGNADGVLDEVIDYLENTSNPWQEIRTMHRIAADDIEFAVGGKIKFLVGRIASTGLAEFVHILGIA